MQPDFSQKTIETVAKRAAFICSNPECRVLTVGPNDDTKKATTIGEAAHIHAARPGGARYDSSSSDVVRGEITNAIWLCRNCHGKVDRDPKSFPANMLFAWRENHEQFVASNLGNTNDSIRYDIDKNATDQFLRYPPVVRRIAIDKPAGWEWRLTAELMRHLNGPVFRKLNDLESGLYTVPYETVSDHDVFDWIQERLHEMGSLVSPIENITSKLNEAWGQPGEPGNADEILHVCELLRDGLEQMVRSEERLHFVKMSEHVDPLLKLLRNCLGDQAKKYANFPDELDEIVALMSTEHGGTIENPLIIDKTIVFELPENWEKSVDNELKRARNKLNPDEAANGLLAKIVTFLIVALIFYLIFS